MDKNLPPHYKVPRPATTDKLSWDVVQLMWQHTAFYDDEATYRRFTARATPGQLAIFATAWYLSEAFNGGHDQFFFNSTGMVWQDALNGFKLLGADTYREILAEALTQFPNSTPAFETAAREVQLDDIDPDVWDALDQRLYDLEDPYEAYTERYINAHPGQFFLPFP